MDVNGTMQQKTNELKANPLHSYGKQQTVVRSNPEKLVKGAFKCPIMCSVWMKIAIRKCGLQEKKLVGQL